MITVRSTDSAYNSPLIGNGEGLQASIDLRPLNML